MDELERIELEAEQAGREDRVAELMAEVDVASEADAAQDEYLWQVWRASLAPEERAALDARLAAERAALEAPAPGCEQPCGKFCPGCRPDPSDDVPF